MARSAKDLAKLVAIHQELVECAERLERAIKGHKKSGLKEIWLHWETVESVVLPRLIDWCIKSEGQARAEQSAERAGLKPQAITEVEKYRRYGRSGERTATRPKKKDE